MLVWLWLQLLEPDAFLHSWGFCPISFYMYIYIYIYIYIYLYVHLRAQRKRFIVFLERLSIWNMLLEMSAKWRHKEVDLGNCDRLSRSESQIISPRWWQPLCDKPCYPENCERLSRPESQLPTHWGGGVRNRCTTRG